MAVAAGSGCLVYESWLQSESVIAIVTKIIKVTDIEDSVANLMTLIICIWIRH